MFQRLYVGPLKNIALMMAYAWELDQPMESKKGDLIEYIMKALGQCLERRALFKVPQQPPAAVRTVYASIAEKYGHRIKFGSNNEKGTSGAYIPLPDIPQLRFIRLIAEFDLGEDLRICRFEPLV